MSAISTAKRRTAARRGFTLIELMVAMVILTVGLFAVIHLQVVVVRGNSYSWERYEAIQLAQSVAEEIRTQSLAWQARSPSTPTPSLNALADFAGLIIHDAPAEGDHLGIGALRALRNFNGNPVAASDAPESAYAINSVGLYPAISPDLDGAKAIFRVHYIAHRVIPAPGQIQTGEMIRFLIYVSWDSKDHGIQNVDWDNWYDPTTFFQRHMVVETMYVAATALW